MISIGDEEGSREERDDDEDLFYVCIVLGGVAMVATRIAEQISSAPFSAV